MFETTVGDGGSDLEDPMSANRRPTHLLTRRFLFIWILTRLLAALSAGELDMGWP
jgi:hypothetical protein